jgi:hypothetical protein
MYSNCLQCIWQEAARVKLASAKYVLELFAMHLPGSHREEIDLASVVHVLKLLALHLPRDRWEKDLASAVHTLELPAMHLPGSRWTEMKFFPS